MGVDDMRLRDYFAGLALTGLLATPTEEIDAKLFASLAYEFADEMMNERWKETEQRERERAERRQCAHKDEQVRKAAHAKMRGESDGSNKN